MSIYKKKIRVPINMPQNGIYVLFIYPAKNETRGDTIKFQGSRQYFTIKEILKFFGVEKLGFDEKIWIKRKNTTGVRSKHYDLVAQLSWEDFEKSTIIIAVNYEDAVKALDSSSNITESAPIASLETKYQKSLEDQRKIWEEKELQKKEHKQKLPKSIALRNQAKRIIARKKQIARIKAQKAKSADDAPTNSNGDHKTPEK